VSGSAGKVHGARRRPLASCKRPTPHSVGGPLGTLLRAGGTLDAPPGWTRCQAYKQAEHDMTGLSGGVESLQQRSSSRCSSGEILLKSIAERDTARWQRGQGPVSYARTATSKCELGADTERERLHRVWPGDGVRETSHAHRTDGGRPPAGR